MCVYVCLCVYRGIHGFVCKQAPDNIARHQAINDVIACDITAAGVPITKELVGLPDSTASGLADSH